MKLRRSTREKKPPQHLQDFQLELDPTESLQTRAIRDELNQVESLLESLSGCPLKSGLTSLGS